MLVVVTSRDAPNNIAMVQAYSMTVGETGIGLTDLICIKS